MAPLGAAVAVGAATLIGGAVAALAAALVPLDAGSGSEAPTPWHVIGFPLQTKPFTRFGLVEVDGKRVLRVEADKSYGILLHPMADAEGGQVLSWRWRVDVPNDASDLRVKSGDDVAAEVCVGFDLPLGVLPFVDRQLLRVARLSSKDHIPAAAVCYVWDAHLAAGTALESVFTRRIRMIVLRGTGTPLGAWSSEKRDVHADFLRLFADEAQTVPPVVGVAIAADADNTKGHSVAYVADVAFVR